MEMLPEFGELVQNLDPGLGKHRGGVASILEQIMSALIESQLTTEMMRSNGYIVCIVSDIWRQIFYKWLVSHINNIIAGPIEEIISGGTASTSSMQTITETALAANHEEAGGLVNNVRKEPVGASLTEPSLEVKTLADMRRQEVSLKAKYVEVSGLLVLSGGGGKATRTLRAVCSLVQVEDGGSAASSGKWQGLTSLEVNYRGRGYLRIIGQCLAQVKCHDLTITSLWRGHTAERTWERIESKSSRRNLEAADQESPACLQTEQLENQLRITKPLTWLLPSGGRCSDIKHNVRDQNPLGRVRRRGHTACCYVRHYAWYNYLHRGGHDQPQISHGHDIKTSYNEYPVDNVVINRSQ